MHARTRGSRCTLLVKRRPIATFSNSFVRHAMPSQQEQLLNEVTKARLKLNEQRMNNMTADQKMAEAMQVLRDMTLLTRAAEEVKQRARVIALHNNDRSKRKIKRDAIRFKKAAKRAKNKRDPSSESTTSSTSSADARDRGADLGGGGPGPDAGGAPMLMA